MILKSLTSKNVKSNLQDISYTFDAVGNITAIDDDSDTDAGKDAAYVYDDLHRLTSATITNNHSPARMEDREDMRRKLKK